MFKNVPIFIRAILSQFHGIGSCAETRLATSRLALYCILLSQQI